MGCWTVYHSIILSFCASSLSCAHCSHCALLPSASRHFCLTARCALPPARVPHAPLCLLTLHCCTHSRLPQHCALSARLLSFCVSALTALTLLHTSLHYHLLYTAHYFSFSACTAPACHLHLHCTTCTCTCTSLHWVPAPAHLPAPPGLTRSLSCFYFHTTHHCTFLYHLPHYCLHHHTATAHCTSHTCSFLCLSACLLTFLSPAPSSSAWVFFLHHCTALCPTVVGSWVWVVWVLTTHTTTLGPTCTPPFCHCTYSAHSFPRPSPTASTWVLTLSHYSHCLLSLPLTALGSFACTSPLTPHLCTQVSGSWVFLLPHRQISGWVHHC